MKFNLQEDFNMKIMLNGLNQLLIYLNQKYECEINNTLTNLYIYVCMTYHPEAQF